MIIEMLISESSIVRVYRIAKYALFAAKKLFYMSLCKVFVIFLLQNYENEPITTCHNYFQIKSNFISKRRVLL